MLLDVRDKAYMLHYIYFGSEDYKVCYQEDKILCPPPKDTCLAISEGDYLHGTYHPATLNRELFVILSNYQMTLIETT